MSDAVRNARFEARKADWLTVGEASMRIRASAYALSPERVPLAEALGRALAEDVEATATLPPWDNSAMDGYAVRGEDVDGATSAAPVVLPVVGAVHAGDVDLPEVGAGEAVRIMTGAPLPPGADSVIRVEDTDAEVDEGRVRIVDDRDRGRHIRPAGQDMRAGHTLLRRGAPITPGTVGVLAAAGRAEVEVGGVPTVALLANGDELRGPERYEEVREGRGIPESNVPMLSAVARSCGARPLDVGVAADTESSLRSHFEAAAEADVLVTIGGASMGEADLVKRVLDDLGYDADFWRVKMRPGSPIGFGTLPRDGRPQPVFSLPGNPSSAFVTFEVFVRPFLLRLAGHERTRRRTTRCTVEEAFSTPAPLTYFQRVVVSEGPDGPITRLTGPQLSGLVTGLALADGLAVVPPDIDRLDVGDAVAVMLLHDRAPDLPPPA